MVGTMASCLARRSSSIDSRCPGARRSEEHTSELQSQSNLVCRLLLEKKNFQPRKLPKSFLVNIPQRSLESLVYNISGDLQKSKPSTPGLSHPLASRIDRCDI